MSGQPAVTAAPEVERGLCFVDADVEDAESALRLLAEAAVQQGYARASFTDAVVERERAHPTGLPLPLPAAIPHADPEHVLRPALAALVPRQPVAFGEMGGRDRTVAVGLVVMLLVTDPTQQVGLLQRLIGVLRREDLDATLLGGLAGPDDLAARLQGLLSA